MLRPMTPPPATITVANRLRSLRRHDPDQVLRSETRQLPSQSGLHRTPARWGLAYVVMQVVIAGGGLAGLRTVEELRARDFGGPITMIAAESRPPYDRPPLSKQALSEQVLLGELLAGEVLAGEPDAA